MNTEDAAIFEQLLDTVFEIMGKKVPSSTAKKIWWSFFGDYSIEEFRTGCEGFLKRQQHPTQPTPAAIMDALRSTAWPSPEQAWNMLPKCDAEGGWLCQEMATAMGAAQDSIDRGDLVAARMAFLESYKRELSATTERKPKWWLSEPNFLSSEARLSWRNEQLGQHPDRRPRLTAEAKSQLEATTGSGRTTSELKRLSENIGSIVPAKSLSVS